MTLKAYQILEKLEKSKMNILEKNYSQNPAGIVINSYTEKKMPSLQIVYDKLGGSKSDHKIQLVKKKNYKRTNLMDFGKVVNFPGFSIVRIPVIESELETEVTVNLYPRNLRNPIILSDPKVKSLDKDKDKLIVEKMDEKEEPCYSIVMDFMVKSDTGNLNHLQMKFRGDYEMTQKEFDTLADLFF